MNEHALSELSDTIREYRSHLDQKTIFQLLYQKSSDAVLIIHNGLFVDSNESALYMLGVSSMDEVLRIFNHHPSALSPEFQPDGSRSYTRSEELLQECMDKGTCRFEWLFNRLDGSKLWVDTVLTRICEGEDEIIHVAWRDISTRKEFEADLMKQKKELTTLNKDLENKTTQLHMLYKRLEYSQKYQKAVFDGQPNIIVANFNVHTLCDGNRAFLDFVGYRDVPSFLADHECICEYFIEKEGYISMDMEGQAWVEYVKENPEYSHYALMKKGDKEHVFSVSVSEVYIENDKINIASFSDITELEEYKKTLEERIKAEVVENRNKDRMLHNQSKSVQMGEMLNMIAHQWRQPLNAISASAISVAMKLELGELEPDDIREHLTYIQWRVQKMSQTINDFMNFFKPDQEMQQFSLNDVIKDIESLMKAQLQGRGIRILYDERNPITIYSYKKELAHVLINIIANARDAYEGLHMESKSITVTLSEREDRQLVLTVRDRAGGINPENMDKIFNPYFTTKDQGKGTGIGLYMSKRIVLEILHGTIDAANTPEGAEFSIIFKNNSIG
ncbi:PAS domain-containing sensor histidine kinase [Sulfuricurvum sp.]|uniref:PAS domain-containing sensor histidine kinase n=1 Tax=Sulfuricurvum sp. TaxID=2025608 RepID=UPI002E3001BF|nr:PAS domain-containing sensor histidine kinase [Sulfuricurvum sp.]HEX5330940.1 PAS domain-containing sensor histidine kinase [Sulfuricurvum sp.]